MANGRFTLGKQSGGTLGLVFPDGLSNTEVVLPESGELATKQYVDELKTIATGTATFNSVTNNINLTGIGIGVEIGDVIQISSAEDAKNNSEFTVEVVTDNNNIIVNQAHANKGTSKNVANRSGDTGVIVKLLSKWYAAPLGLGQGWVDMTSSRIAGTTYNNNTNRTISISAFSNFNNIPKQINLYTNGMLISSNSITGAFIVHCYGNIDKYSNYIVYMSGDNLIKYLELR